MKSLGVTIMCAFMVSAFLMSSPSHAGSGDLEVAIIPDEISQGDAVFLTVRPVGPVKRIAGEWKGREVFFSEDDKGGAFFSLLGVDLDERPGEKKLSLRMEDPAGNVSKERVSFRVRGKDFPVQRLTLPEHMVTLSPENLARYKRERDVLRRMFASLQRERQWGQAFIMPVDGPVISPFGVRRILNEKPRSPHSGVDLKAAAGVPVRATSSGMVSLVADHFFSGRSVFIDHGMGIVSMYFHLSEVRVGKGERVSLGQVIGAVGQTGRATGPHLHWGVRIQGSRVDPLSLLDLFRGE
jgi:murein DD-endopeptidase MepM/ murein hydrolase activator NlpD